ncbi:MAG: aminoacyl-tRNA hydrolase [Proteobacteria bacterium]|nr:aminoacyl-tRNA hydrolase [Pseudomonadota bacterium]
MDIKNLLSKSEYTFSFSRSSGPGGQNVNKVNSKATFIWQLSENKTFSSEVIQRFKDKYKNKINSENELILTSEEYRDKPRNIEECFSKLSKMLSSVLLPPKKRKKTKPSRSAVEKRITAKKHHSKQKQNRKVSNDY